MPTTTHHISQPLRRRFGLAPAALAMAAMLALSACGGGDVDEKAQTTVATKNKAYTVGGTVGFGAPAQATVTLRLTALSDGSTTDVTVANNSPDATPYTFDKAFIKKDGFAVDLVDDGGYLCSFNGSSPSGEIDKADITDLNLYCDVRPTANSTADFTVFGAPAGSTLTAVYGDGLSEPVFKTFTIGADGETYSFDEKFFDGTQFLFDVTQSPTGFSCRSNSIALWVNVIEPIVTCTQIPPAN